MAADLHKAISAVGDMPELPPAPEETLPVDGTDWLLEGYAQVLYQFALTAIWLGRPVAIEGFLQGDDWIAVCESRAQNRMLTYRIQGRMVFPDPDTIWLRASGGGERSLIRSGSLAMSDLEYRIQYVPDLGQRETEIAELNDRWAKDPTHLLPPRPDSYDPDDAPFRKRWHQVVQVNAGAVPLPAHRARDFPPPSYYEPDWITGPRLRLGREEALGYDKYPEELRAFLDVRDGPAAIERLQRRLAEVTREDQALSNRVQAALGISPEVSASPGATTDDSALS